MATTKSPPRQASVSAKQEFLDLFEREHATTVRVLRNYPKDKLDLQPHPRCRTARDLAFLFVIEQMMGEKALTTGFDWSAPLPPLPPAPDSLDTIIDALEQGHKRVADLVRGMSDEQLLKETVQFFTAPRTLGDVPRMEFLWVMLHDQIHHRGQFSIYLRMADGKVPSIYGPSGDEPFF